jgi:uncharacterized protein YecT (DUF1311 family)
MRRLLMFVCIVCTSPAYAGVLETCYQAGGNAEEVNACLENYLSTAQGALQDTLTIAKQQAEALGGRATEHLTEAQSQWEAATLSDCAMHRVAAGSGAGGAPFEKACLIAAYSKRSKELQGFFPAISRSIAP